MSIFHWDPKKHPRNLLGQFRKVLGELSDGDILEINDPVIGNVKRVGDKFEIDGVEYPKIENVVGQYNWNLRTKGRKKGGMFHHPAVAGFFHSEGVWFGQYPQDEGFNLGIINWDENMHPRDLLGRWRHKFTDSIDDIDLPDVDPPPEPKHSTGSTAFPMPDYSGKSMRPVEVAQRVFGMTDNPFVHGIMRPGGIPEHPWYDSGRVSRSKLLKYKQAGYTEIALRDKHRPSRYSRIAVMNIDDLLDENLALPVRWVNG